MKPLNSPARRRALTAVSLAVVTTLSRAAGAPDLSSLFSRRGSAPELVGIETWLNSEPLTIEGLRGQVVMVDFWTYACVNCINTLPYVVQWHERYKDRGLVVIGVHTPEFAFERETGNVRKAILRHGIHYPVAQDNKFATWNAYRNRYWPTAYLIDRTGQLVYSHSGEGAYDEIERTIKLLLA